MLKTHVRCTDILKVKSVEESLVKKRDGYNKIINKTRKQRQELEGQLSLFDIPNSKSQAVEAGL